MSGAPPRSVLLTRPAFNEAAGALVAARGYQPVMAPFGAVRHFPLRLPRAVQAILLTSGNALPALPAAAAVPVLAVGDATAVRARARGFADVRSASGDAAALARLATRLLDPHGAPLLLASGAGQGRALAAGLRRRGFRVIRRVCYLARPARRFPAAAAEALRSGRLHAVLFLSNETARAFVRLLPPQLSDRLGGVAALAISRRVALTLEALPWSRICRAAAPTLDDVLAQL